MRGEPNRWTSLHGALLESVEKVSQAKHLHLGFFPQAGLLYRSAELAQPEPDPRSRWPVGLANGDVLRIEAITPAASWSGAWFCAARLRRP